MCKKNLRIISRLIIAVFLLSLFSFSALATNYDSYAKSLSTLGVFKGTGKGFELERAPTRAESLVMLIRLLGAEKEALAMKDVSTKFTDVPEWVRGYVAYAVKNGLTRGISDTKFGSSLSTDARMYTTFLLRSLGYNDNAGDFSYTKSIQFARSIGLIDSDFESQLERSSFLRGHIAKMSYDALRLPLRGNDVSLIQSLVAKGSINAAAANAFTATNLSAAPVTDEKSIQEIAKNANSVVYIESISSDASSLGSGFIINPNGTIVTNYHVIEGAQKLIVTLNDNRSFSKDITVLGYSRALDLAIIKINATGLPAVKLGDSSSVRVADNVVAIGSPMGQFNTVSNGIVSAMWGSHIQISAPISHGSSGGALFNMRGEVIGVTSSGIDEGQNLGFAIPINRLKDIQLNKNFTLSQFASYAASHSEAGEPPMLAYTVKETPKYMYIQWNEVPEADYYHVYFCNAGSDTYYYDTDERGQKKKYYYGKEYSAKIGPFESGKRVYVIVTSVQDGVESEDSTQFILTKSAPDVDAMYYTGFKVPDFGKYFGYTPAEYKKDAYLYNGLTKAHIQEYESLLDEFGFEYYGEDYDAESDIDYYFYSNESLNLDVILLITGNAGKYDMIVYISKSDS